MKSHKKYQHYERVGVQINFAIYICDKLFNIILKI